VEPNYALPFIDNSPLPDHTPTKSFSYHEYEPDRVWSLLAPLININFEVEGGVEDDSISGEEVHGSDATQL
jgi:hypothetical protein